jgi:pyridoxine 4-dehydrogenase
MKDIVEHMAATPAKVALTWLMKKSPAIILIPGTCSISHLERNAAACAFALSDTNMENLQQLTVEGIS